MFYIFSTPRSFFFFIILYFLADLSVIYYTRDINHLFTLGTKMHLVRWAPNKGRNKFGIGQGKCTLHNKPQNVKQMLPVSFSVFNSTEFKLCLPLLLWTWNSHFKFISVSILYCSINVNKSGNQTLSTRGQSRCILMPRVNWNPSQLHVDLMWIYLDTRSNWALHELELVAVTSCNIISVL